ncbi:MAG: amino acid ABC transporter permease, partial [Pseudomonadota bacterium]
MTDTSQNIAFVRTETLPQQAPPASEVGVIGWMRHNLFNGLWGTALTLVSLYFVYYLLSGFLPWLFNGVWNTSNIRECREVLDGATGGCFSVLTERWNQLLFGFTYPEAL